VVILITLGIEEMASGAVLDLEMSESFLAAPSRCLVKVATAEYDHGWPVEGKLAFF
jgi:hypothetical protein